jgi:folate-binding protein YgfZ
VLDVTGADRLTFLQGLVTSDVLKLGDGIRYAALLTPQGKYLADFFLVGRGDRLLIDVHESLAEGLVRRLGMYRLRADVQIAPSALKVTRGLGAPPPGALTDPRHEAMGWRLYAATEGGEPAIDWDAIRVRHAIPEAGRELVPEETYILEAGFERLHGVDFRKGCYVGQEVTARMKHKTELRKGIVRVSVEGEAEEGAEIMAGAVAAGRLMTRAGGEALAWLRFDRAEGGLTAGGATVALAGGRPGG